MRTIKFRCLNLELSSNKTEWVYYGINSKPHCVGGTYISPDLQWTGLKDKTGKDIYEGDIIRCIKYGIDENFNDTDHVWDDTTGPVEWFDKEAGFAQRAETVFSGAVQLCFPDVIEVLGNVYENPELLVNAETKKVS